MSDYKKTSTAQEPFDNPDCDIILRSSDGVDFHVFKFIISHVSSVFKDMFTHPQAESDVSSVPVISVKESSTTLNSLLLLCYPATIPTFNSLEDAEDVLKAVMKYEMLAVLSRAGDLIVVQFVSTNSLRLYALSCSFGWEHHAQTAATQALKIKDLGRPSSDFAGIDDISAFDYHRLLAYHYECGVAAKAVGQSLSWLGPLANDMCMWKCNSEDRASGPLYINAQLGPQWLVAWFHEYLVSIGNELLARPCGSILWESEFYDRAVTKAVQCTFCRGTVVGTMSKLRTLHVAEVKRVVADVRLKSPRANSLNKCVVC
ncbi:hypothetical protein AZE42_06845 [Rhizopogon vesiculosus]|uniref:BTB domain-containing protein n=1 Tax=Rhizopogon vesiculosus TaxID=180088 RepID=A0A1J8Q5J0_9AGAM|nr:hypothetical protein AZE42_06845 [Rhizopogon vesiculosus]